jgi:ATP-dependent helicase HrpA
MTRPVEPTAGPEPTPRRGPLQVHFPEELPISLRAGDILEALGANPVVIVAGATGSGKTTQLPKVALQLHECQQAKARSSRPQQVGITQPRRIAATSVAARVASELECELGREVGYQIRFENRSKPDTLLKFMTDGILLAEIQGDPLLRRYHTIIIDEAHERSLTIDFLLGLLKQILRKRRDLKLIISSATIETQRFSEFFDGAPVIEVEGRTFPVDVLYEPPDAKLDPRDAVADAVESIVSLDPDGDLLVFLPGEREITETERVLSGRQLRGAEVLPLFGRLSAAEQNRVFASGSRRRIILATNVAETSLTLPGIVYVVDAGVARLSRYDPRTGTTRLQIESISQASANQRKGRSGRLRDGICVRLYEEEDFDSRPPFTDPEVLRVGLAGVILRMKASRLGGIEDFPFLDAPQPRAVAEGYRVLEELGALTPERELTVVGKQLASFPVDPRIGRMILAAHEHGCLDEMLVVAAGLEIRDPRERPRGSEQKADQLHRSFRDESSDFAGWLRLWAFVSEAACISGSNLRRVCKQNFISYNRIREWREVHRQLSSSVRELKLGRGKSDNAAKVGAGEALHRSLVTGLLSRIGMYDAQKRSYVGARQTRFALHPSSALAKKPPAWVMAFELVETSQLFARTTAKIEPVWLDEVAGHLLTRSYSEPHWSEKSARASVREHATLYGLPVLRDRSMDYAKISPVRARLMFIEHALVRGEFKTKGAFAEKNSKLRSELGRLRDKARQSELLVDEDALVEFFDRRLPESVVNGKTFEDWRRRAERDAPDCLCLSLTDVMSQEQTLVPEHYPDELQIAGAQVRLDYRFDPRADDDGVTLTLPLALVPRVTPDELDWTIPAWHEQRILELLERLPKAQRKQLGSLPALAKVMAHELIPFDGPFLSALVKAIRAATGVDVPASSIRSDQLPGYLRLNLRVCDEANRVLGETREFAPLLKQHGARARQALQEHHPAAKTRRQITTWDFKELPRFASRNVLGAEVHVYPALVDQGQSVELTFKDSEAEAVSASIAGVTRLIALAHQRPLAAIARRLPRPFTQHLDVPTSTLGAAQFRESALLRIVEEAHPIPNADSLPRTETAFNALLEAGLPRLEAAATKVVQAIAHASAELDETLRALDDASKQRAGASAIRDMRAQLGQLYPPDLLSRTDLGWLSHYPRYLRAMRIRLERAQHNPQKDADKLQQFSPLWDAFSRKRFGLQDQQTARALRWAFEELRVVIFAPELKSAFPVSAGSLAQAIASLDG